MFRPLVHPSLNGATILVGGAAGERVLLKPVEKDTVASSDGRVRVYWPIGQNPLPMVWVDGKLTQDHNIALRGKVHRPRFGVL